MSGDYPCSGLIPKRGHVVVCYLILVPVRTEAVKSPLAAEDYKLSAMKVVSVTSTPNRVFSGWALGVVYG